MTWREQYDKSIALRKRALMIADEVTAELEARQRVVYARLRAEDKAAGRDTSGASVASRRLHAYHEVHPRGEQAARVRACRVRPLRGRRARGARMSRPCTISGGGVEATCPEPGAALSKAITLASRATGETTLYVRHPNGDPVGRVERDASGRVLCYRAETKR